MPPGAGRDLVPASGRSIALRPRPRARGSGPRTHDTSSPAPGPPRSCAARRPGTAADGCDARLRDLDDRELLEVERPVQIRAADDDPVAGPERPDHAPEPLGRLVGHAPEALAAVLEPDGHMPARPRHRPLRDRALHRVRPPVPERPASARHEVGVGPLVRRPAGLERDRLGGDERHVPVPPTPGSRREFRRGPGRANGGRRRPCRLTRSTESQVRGKVAASARKSDAGIHLARPSPPRGLAVGEELVGPVGKLGRDGRRGPDQAAPVAVSPVPRRRPRRARRRCRRPYRDRSRRAGNMSAAGADPRPPPLGSSRARRGARTPRPRRRPSRTRVPDLLRRAGRSPRCPSSGTARSG